MILDPHIKELLLTAQSKALATYSEYGLNVVPVSVLRMIDEDIILVNYFMDKTLKNIQENPTVALVCWTGTTGFQIRAHVDYQTSGEHYELIKNWSRDQFPEREVKGILILKPDGVFNISLA